MDNQKEKFTDIYTYILQEEQAFKTRKIQLGSNWMWNMYEHIDMSFMLKNSKFLKGDNDNFSRPNNNIIIPIANVNYRSEGFDIKNVDLYVENSDYFHLSLMGRKYHNKWALKYSIDTAVDESVESYFDYGLALVKNANDKRPVIIDLKADLVFCNQSDVLSGSICLKHNYGIDEILEMKGKWKAEEIDRAILMSSFTTKDNEGNQVQSPNKGIEVYELHGVYPNSWLTDSVEDGGKYSRQMHIVTFYVDRNSGEKQGITLFKGKVTQKFKALKRDNVSKRACGRGGIEELFHPQIWSNYGALQIAEQLEAVSKVVTKTNDKALAQRNNLKGIKQQQIVYLDEGKTWEQMMLTLPNNPQFDRFVNEWEQRGRIISSATDQQLGINPQSGTPLGTTEIVTAQGQGTHVYRQGKIATFWGEIYRDWVLDYIQKEINSGDEWLDELSLEELKEVCDAATVNQVNKRIKDARLAGKVVTTEQRDLLMNTIKESFMKGGRQRFMKIMKDEFSKIKLNVRFNIAGKQSAMYERVAKLNSIFARVFANPAILEDEAMGSLFNNILESAGLSPLNFTSFTKRKTETPKTEMPEPKMSPIQLPDLQTTNNITNE